MKVSKVVTRRRMLWTLLGLAVLFGSLVVRLAYVQLSQGEELTAKVEDSLRRNIPFTAKRGEIMDREGVPLVSNITTPTVYAVPVQVKEKQKTAQQLAPLLGMTEEKLMTLLSKKEMSVKLQPGGRKITMDLAASIRDLQLPGIVVAEDSKRYYPYGDLAAHILGFTGIDNQGITGVESIYDNLLKGIAGNISYLSDAGGRLMPGSSEKYSAPQDGLNLQLTIDKQIQSIMERELDQAMVKYQAQGAWAIAMNPKNGEILAMASRPGYEPASYKEYDAQIYNRNLPIWMTYEPGSTFKIITLAAALQEGKVDLQNDHFYDPGFIEVAGAKLRCWKKGGHGSQTFLQVVENSCNPGFVALGQRLGKESLFKYIRDFGFGSKTGIDLNGEANGILFKLNQVGPVELSTTAFGQGVSVTPIQQIAAVSAAINGGNLYKPHVTKAWVNPVTGETVSEVKPELVRQVISEETSKKVRAALESVVAKGTGRPAFIDGYRVGGKTGTAQKVVNGRYSPTEHIVSFIGFAPADDPQIVVYTAVDNPKGIQFGGVVAAPIVQNILEDSLHYMKIPERSDQLPKTYKYGETPIVTVPDLTGATVQDIYEDLNMNFNLARSGTGNTVINQAPKAGARVEQGSTIRIYMGASSE
ncbi:MULTISPECIES: stage V sporulation protein D [Paenibacillus]|uniref:stage V sporulation protein D n=1 Tax=Paenibacillus TaxID=44249 RepID=UPI00096C3E48|nr:MULTISPECIES: stage V sporulation protein D [Paenibacillus]MDH6429950.1 stage V sporulation protein D (sporulation-specific penicillin-binding protein) [Paenibacillus sp. PastH-4]MDH6445948.1 stage V sporulation protein D (sporulation-specific penicillin-binding protein) [Paenibacillus sp. PastF-4]MDH6530581.1 stage V sporulation protein D (sporulation-specific penicillin-binding protein) [Paenibacillus sp. PastH-3]OMD57234.1 stage V sporulation protein D [Paenibacillus odorifer]